MALSNFNRKTLWTHTQNSHHFPPPSSFSCPLPIPGLISASHPTRCPQYRAPLHGYFSLVPPTPQPLHSFLLCASIKRVPFSDGVMTGAREGGSHREYGLYSPEGHYTPSDSVSIAVFRSPPRHVSCLVQMISRIVPPSSSPPKIYGLPIQPNDPAHNFRRQRLTFRIGCFFVCTPHLAPYLFSDLGTRDELRYFVA